MSLLDPRLHAFREDLADAQLKGQVDAARFAPGEPARIAVAAAAVRKRPDVQAMQLTQALFGEACSVFERRDGWAWVQLSGDGYVGYVQESALSAAGPAPTHRVTSVSTWHFSGPDLKTQPAQNLPMNARVTVADYSGAYALLAGGGAIYAAHLKPLAEAETDFVNVAERFLHVPYYWGGKTGAGTDCSGLVQSALTACGIPCPRDSDMQEKALGAPIADYNTLQRGDLVFWPGHVGIMQSATQLLHANGHFMMVTSEPLADAVGRSEKLISSVRRLSAKSPKAAAK